MSLLKPNVRQPARVIVGHCPECKSVAIVENNYEVWQYVVCKCGWHGDTLGLIHRIRYETDGRVIASVS